MEAWKPDRLPCSQCFYGITLAWNHSVWKQSCSSNHLPGQSDCLGGFYAVMERRVMQHSYTHHLSTTELNLFTYSPKDCQATNAMVAFSRSQLIWRGHLLKARKKTTQIKLHEAFMQHMRIRKLFSLVITQFTQLSAALDSEGSIPPMSRNNCWFLATPACKIPSVAKYVKVSYMCCPLET